MRLSGRSVLVGLLAAAGLTGILLGAAALLNGPERAKTGASPGGRMLYGRHCAVCHGQAGKGDGPGAAVLRQSMPDFTDGAAMQKVGDAFLAEIIKKGGSQFGRSNAMPAWGMKLSDAEIRSLVAYIRSLARPVPSPPPRGG